MSCEFYLVPFIFQICIQPSFFIRQFFSNQYLSRMLVKFNHHINQFHDIFMLLECRLSIHSHFHHPDISFFQLRLYVFISCYTKMLIFCSLYVFHSFPDSKTFPFQPFFLLGSMYLFTLFDLVTYLIYIVGKSTPFSILLESLVS